MHRQAWTKVNALVDSELQEMVILLNSIPELQTTQSCEGEAGGPDAYVYFYFGDWKRISQFLFGTVEPVLRETEASVSVEIFNGSDPLGKISFRAEALSNVTSALKRLVSRRTFVCSYGKGHREPRS